MSDWISELSSEANKLVNSAVSTVEAYARPYTDYAENNLVAPAISSFHRAENYLIDAGKSVFVQVCKTTASALSTYLPSVASMLRTSIVGISLADYVHALSNPNGASLLVSSSPKNSGTSNLVKGVAVYVTAPRAAVPHPHSAVPAVAFKPTLVQNIPLAHIPHKTPPTRIANAAPAAKKAPPTVALAKVVPTVKAPKTHTVPTATGGSTPAFVIARVPASGLKVAVAPSHPHHNKHTRRLELATVAPVKPSATPAPSTPASPATKAAPVAVGTAPQAPAQVQAPVVPVLDSPVDSLVAGALHLTESSPSPRAASAPVASPSDVQAAPQQVVASTEPAPVTKTSSSGSLSTSVSSGTGPAPTSSATATSSSLVVSASVYTNPSSSKIAGGVPSSTLASAATLVTPFGIAPTVVYTNKDYVPTLASAGIPTDSGATYPTVPSSSQSAQESQAVARDSGTQPRVGGESSSATVARASRDDDSGNVPIPSVGTLLEHQKETSVAQADPVQASNNAHTLGSVALQGGVRQGLASTVPSYTNTRSVLSPNTALDRAVDPSDQSPGQNPHHSGQQGGRHAQYFEATA